MFGFQFGKDTHVLPESPLLKNTGAKMLDPRTVGTLGYWYDLQDGNTVFAGDMAALAAKTSPVGTILDKIDTTTYPARPLKSRLVLGLVEDLGYEGTYTQYNGKYCLAVDGSSVQQYYASALVSIAQPFHIFCVQRYEDGQQWLSQQNSANYVVGRTLNDTNYRVQMYAGGAGLIESADNAGAVLSRFSVHEMFFSGNSSFYKIDGVTVASGGGGNPGTLGLDGIRVCGRYNEPDANYWGRWTGKLGEILIYSAQVPTIQATSLRTKYLNPKWGI